MSRMGNDEINKRLLAVAISAVLLESSSGESIEPSIGRESDSSWSIDHRRMAIGKTSQLESNSRRSTKR